MSDDTALLIAIRRTGGDPADLPFWQACAQGRFMVHRCAICGTSYWPASRCVTHGNADMHWVDASGHALLYTYTVMHHTYTPAMAGKTPYVVAVVKLAEGPFFHTNLIDCAFEDVAIDMPLEAVIVADASGLSLPMFRPVKRP